ncbi:MAG: AmmeMemoRadiSam system protein B [Nanoarchaeota archaeon]
MEIIKKAVVAGYFYPSDKNELAKMIGNFLKKVPDTKIKNIKAIIAPHAGYVYSGQVAAYVYKLLKNIKNKLKTIIVGPSHYEYFDGLAMENSDFWETPLGKVKVAKEKIISNKIKIIPEAFEKEHSLEVQIPFLQYVLKDFEIQPIAVGNVDYVTLAKELERLIKKDTVIIISSDLSHFYNYQDAVKIDSFANTAIPKLDIKTVEEKVEACGKTGILSILYLAKKHGWKCKLLCYKNSGDVTKDKSKVVGYGSYVFYK